MNENLAAFLVDFGVPALWKGTTTGTVIFDLPDTDILAKRVQTRGYKMTFPSTTFVGIARSDSVVIPYPGGATYKVLEVNSIDDGAFYSADLST